MDLTDLVIFKAVVQEGGIVRAARKLHRVQSNVTTRIKQLEESVGVQLFFRERQRLHLSPDGELLLSYADRLLQLADEAKASVGGGELRGALRLGALESTTASRLPALLGEFHRRHPDVRIELFNGTNDALVAALADRRVDAAFVAEQPNREGMSHVPAFAERLVLITAPSHRPVLRPRDVANDTVIAFPTGCAYRRVLERWLGDRNLLTVRVMELSSYHAIVTCVGAGTGIAVIPESVLDTVQGRGVSKHAIPKVLSKVVTPFIWRSGEASPAVLALKKILGTERRSVSSLRSKAR